MESISTAPQSSELNLWVQEAIGDFAAMQYRVTETLYSGRSQFQKVDVLRTKGFGVMLFLDGLVMVSERDEFVYHDMIAHVPLFVHPNPRKVLVIGGGDGGTAREVLRHPGVTSCWMVEIDGKVVEVSKQFLPQTACAFDHPKLNLLITDGVRFLQETEERFDVILIDSTDPIGPAEPLFGEAFYANVHRVLNDDGIVVAQGESPFYEIKAQHVILGNLAKSFPRVNMYNYTNLTYPGGVWSFMFASKGLCPLGDFRAERVHESGLAFSYYNPEVHRAAFQLPTFQKEHHGDLLTPYKIARKPRSSVREKE